MFRVFLSLKSFELPATCEGRVTAGTDTCLGLLSSLPELCSQEQRATQQKAVHKGHKRPFHLLQGKREDTSQISERRLWGGAALVILDESLNAPKA